VTVKALESCVEALENSVEALERSVEALELTEEALDSCTRRAIKIGSTSVSRIAAGTIQGGGGGGCEVARHEGR